MFLLRPLSISTEDPLVANLHSNMFLLRRCLYFRSPFSEYQFTFQYVSIKTILNPPFYAAVTNLHSNMFLLRPFAPHPAPVQV